MLYSEGHWNHKLDSGCWCPLLILMNTGRQQAKKSAVRGLTGQKEMYSVDEKVCKTLDCFTMVCDII